MRTTTDTYSGKRFRWNATVSVNGIVVPARETEHAVTHLHPSRVTAKLLHELNPGQVEARYYVPRSQVWEGSRGRQSGRVHLHVAGRALCGRKRGWYEREPDAADPRCVRCEATAAKRGIEWPEPAESQAENSVPKSPPSLRVEKSVPNFGAR